MKNKFIDLEAQDDSSEEFDDFSEEEGHSEETSSESIPKRSRIEHEDQHSARPLFPVNQAKRVGIFDAIVGKHTQATTQPTEELEEPIDSPVQRTVERSLKPDDWPLWRVKCIPGEEYDVLHQLISKHIFLSKELRSAFVNPQNPGTVYLEARFLHSNDVTSLFHVLQTLSSIKLKTITVVSRDETRACFSIRDDPNSTLGSYGEWVTVKRGLYKGDVGVVVDTFERWGGMRGNEVALVPRLSGIQTESRKRKNGSSSRLSKERPPPRLFDPENCVQDMLRKTETGYKYNHWKFENGLILKSFHSSSLEPARIMPSELLPPFRQSKHPLIRSMPVPEQWHFEVGENVWVSSSQSTPPMLATILETDVENGLARGLCIVDTVEGHQLFSPLCFSKAINPGHFVEILDGEHVGQSGFVVSRNEALLGIAPGRFGSQPNLWAHVNSVKLVSPPVAPVVTEPWIDLEVVIKAGAYSSLKAVVKHVRPDGRGSLRLAVYVPRIFRTLDIDLFAVAELKTGQLLFEYQPLQPHQQQFKVLPELRAMRTGQVPWVGMEVNIVAGEYKGQRGIVRDVNRYTYDPRTPKKRSGLTITLERLVMGASASNQLIKVDYNEVRYHRTAFKLADLFRPSELQSLYYLPLEESVDRITGDSYSENPMSVSYFENPMPADSGSKTPMPTEYEKVHVFTGVWSPGSQTPVISAFPNSTPWYDTPASGDTDPSSSNSSDAGGGVSTSNSSDTGGALLVSSGSDHWILHSKLLGIPIRVDIEAKSGDETAKQGVFVQTVMESECIVPILVNSRGRHSVVPVANIVKCRERPKPTERSLMVVIEGPHIGKFVRQIYYFYKGSKQDENAQFIAAVVDRSGQFEKVSDEILNLDRNEVELVQETPQERKYINGILKDIRDSKRTSRPEVRP